MFEQSLYEQEKSGGSASAEREGDLFRNYELKTWDLGPRVYKILGISAAANLLALLVFAQTSVLTMKGCDSPLVGSVCQALDTVYVGTLLFGTQREYVDQQYEKTDLGNADITYLDYTGVQPPLSYPDGYFQLANPEQFVAGQQQPPVDPSLMSGVTPGFPNFSIPGQPTERPMTGNNMLNTKPHYPKPPRNNVVQGNLPSDINGGTVADTDTASNKRTGNGKTTSNANTGNPTVGNTNTTVNTNPTTDANGEPLINKRPFVDLANNVNDLLDKNQVKLESPFVVAASGKLNKDGKLDPKSFKYVQAASNDVKMIDVVKETIEAINDSGYLQYLSAISGRDFSLSLQQDDQNISGVVQSEMESDTRARSIKSSLDLLISIKKSSKSGQNADQNDKDDLILLENAKVDTDGKKVIIRFVVPKEVALPMIQRKLAEQKNAPKQPNGNAVNKSSVNAGK